jgi:hypothetical protein
MNFQEGITRVRYRDGFDTVRLMEKGEGLQRPRRPARDVVVPRRWPPAAGGDLGFQLPAL